MNQQTGPKLHAHNDRYSGSARNEEPKLQSIKILGKDEADVPNSHSNRLPEVYATISERKTEPRVNDDLKLAANPKALSTANGLSQAKNRNPSEDGKLYQLAVQTKESPDEAPRKASSLLPGFLDQKQIIGKKRKAQDQSTGRIDNKQQLRVPSFPTVHDHTSSPSSVAGAWSPSTPYAAQHSENTSPEDGNLAEDINNTAGKDEYIGGKGYHCPTPGQAVATARLSPVRHSISGNSATPDAQLQLEVQQASVHTKNSTATDEIDNVRVPSQALSRTLTSSIPQNDGAASTVPSHIFADSTIGSQKNAPNSVSVRHNSPQAAGELSVAGTNSDNGSDADAGLSNSFAPKPEVEGVAMEDVSTATFTRSQSSSTSKASRADFVTELKSSALKDTSSESFQARILPVASSPRTELPTVRGKVNSKDDSRHVPPNRPKSSDSKDLKGNHRRKDRPRDVVTPAIDPEYMNLKNAAEDGRDYLLPLFRWQAYQPQKATPLVQLLATSHKVLSTSNHYAGLREEQDARILRRVHQLQSTNRWSFRQLERCLDPPHAKCHLDALIDEMKWLQTDFEEERDWKTAVALKLANWCAEWVHGSAKKRRSLQLNTKTTNRSTMFAQESVQGSSVTLQKEYGLEIGAHNVSSCIAGDAGEESDDKSTDFNSSEASSLSTTLSLSNSDVILQVNPGSGVFQKIERIPLVCSNSDKYISSPEGALSPEPNHSLVPVSELITGKLIPLASAPPRKRSRYEYEEEDESLRSRSHKRISSIDSIHSIHSVRSMSMLTSGRPSRSELPPEQTDVALFNPENKHVRDRLHAGHAFRPPSEFNMPSISFFESRVSSQWLWDEDQKLRSLVREYSYNWSLISASLALPSAFTSGAERRTPWECFERWVQLEGLPAEMSKTPYFKTYQSRLEAAQRTITAQHQTAQQQTQQQIQGSGQQQLGTTLRRRTTQPIRVERRKNNRYLGWIDCMRKIARRRETVQHKQQEGKLAVTFCHFAPGEN